MKILLVEDDVKQAEALCKLLKVGQTNLVVMHTVKLGDGLRIAMDEAVNIVLLDLCLPDSNGWRSTVEAIPRFPCPVIIISGMDDPEQEIQLAAFEHGAQNYFRKPIGAEVLAAQLLHSATAAYLRQEAPKRLAL